MEQTLFSQRFNQDSPATSLMKDIGNLSREQGYYMLGGGNPAVLPELTEIFGAVLREIGQSSHETKHSMMRYSSPNGEKSCMENLAGYLSNSLKQEISPNHLTLVNGSQSIFYPIFNLYGGKTANGYKKILLLQNPEYLGYLDCGVDKNIFALNPPKRVELDDVLFENRINFDTLEIGEDIGAVCISRPCNPTGGVIGDDDLRKLEGICRRHNVPLIVDGAYGHPFPALIYEDTEFFWTENMILICSLSKIGLPAVRSGFVVASEKISEVLYRINACFCLAPNSMGISILNNLLKDNRINDICANILKPYYLKQREIVLESVRKYSVKCPVKVHNPAGAFFMWLEFPSLKIGVEEFYNKLKEEMVITVPGPNFSVTKDPNEQMNKAVRISYASPPEDILEGLKRIFAVTESNS